MKKTLTILAILSLVTLVIFSIGLTKSSKHTESGWLGIQIQTVNEDFTDAFDLEVEYGAIINVVINGSPADDADLEEGDIIVAFNGNKVDDVDDLLDFLEDIEDDDTVTLTIYRDDDKFDVDITLDKTTKYFQTRKYFDNAYRYLSSPRVPRVPKVPKAPRAIVGIPNIVSIPQFARYSERAFMGVHLSDLSRQLGEYFGVKKGRGVLITEVVDDSPAEDAGLAAGDIIIALDDEKVYDYDDIQDLLGDYEPGDEISVSILRNKQNKQVKLTLDEDDDYYDDHFYFKAPDITIDIPRMKGLHKGYYLDRDYEHYFDDDDLNDIMDELEEYLEDIEEYNDEIEDLQDEIDDVLKEEIEDYLEEIEEFQDDLEDLELNDNRKIRREVKKLEKELKKLKIRL